jgi:hypothetical protein
VQDEEEEDEDEERALSDVEQLLDGGAANTLSAARAAASSIKGRRTPRKRAVGEMPRAVPKVGLLSAGVPACASLERNGEWHLWCVKPDCLDLPAWNQQVGSTQCGCFRTWDRPSNRRAFLGQC